MKIILNDESFRYDVHSLVKAFYPEEELNFDIISGTEPGVKFISSSGSSSDIFDEVLSVNIPKEITKNRTEAKNIFKRTLYELLSERCNRKLPWGTLTGIRPVKIPAKLLSQGKSDEEILSYMKDTYYISDKKSLLALDIAKREAGNLLRVANVAKNGKGLSGTSSLYVGIPFCPSICAYCSFSSYPVGVYQNKIKLYLEALKSELEYTARIIEKGKNKTISTIYIGGGTPSTLDPEDLEDLIKFIKTKFDLSNLLEFSVECGRPDSITKEKLEVLKSSGVNRISINPQSMNDKTLNLIGRAHCSKDIEKAFELARLCGFDNINCDLIAGLFGEGPDEVKYTLNKIKELQPENLTVHSLAIKRSSRINLEWENHKQDLSEEVFELFYDCARDLGLKPYYLYRQKQIAGNLENIGFAKEGLECLYNLLIMGEYQDIIACGAGAVSKFLDDDKKPLRVTNVKDVDVYIERIAEMRERKTPWL